MNIGFFHIQAGESSDEGYACAKLLVASVRRCLPSAQIVHFTDLTSPGVKGVDAVRRKPSEPMALLRMRHHAGVDGEWLFVDTDVIVQRSAVRKVFDDEDFDIAITDRTWPHLRAAVGFTEAMPFNTGVMFSRCPRFWGDVYCRLRHLEPAQQQWMGDQEVICEIVTEESPRYRVRHLRGHKYNFPPSIPNDVPNGKTLQEDAYIVHYKGPKRKPLMMARRAEFKV